MLGKLGKQLCWQAGRQLRPAATTPARAPPTNARFTSLDFFLWKAELKVSKACRAIVLALPLCASGSTLHHKPAFAHASVPSAHKQHIPKHAPEQRPLARTPACALDRMPSA